MYEWLLGLLTWRFWVVMSGSGVGFVLLMLVAWRGRVVWSGPRCGGRGGRCGYELRGREKVFQGRCPECGQYLNEVGVAEFVRRRFHWGVMLVAVLVLLLPMGVHFGRVVHWQYVKWRYSPQYSLRNVDELLLREVAGYMREQPLKVDEWQWRLIELLKESQGSEGDLLEVFYTLRELLRDETFITKVRSYELEHVIKALPKHMHTNEQMMFNLYLDWYGREWRVKQEAGLTEKRYDFAINAGTNYPSAYKAIDDVYELKHVKEVRVNGELVHHEIELGKTRKPVRVIFYREASYGDDTLPGYGEVMAFGENEVELVIERVLVKSEKRLNVKKVKREDWPTDVLWQEEVVLKKQIVMYESRDKPLFGVEDETYRERLKSEIEVERMVARRMGERVRLAVELKRTERRKLTDAEHLAVVGRDLSIYLDDPYTFYFRANATFGDDEVVMFHFSNTSKNAKVRQEGNVITRVSRYIYYCDVESLDPGIGSARIEMNSGLKAGGYSRSRKLCWKGSLSMGVVEVERWDLIGSE
ncbi:hypothetical protein KS4_02590 [Poriferisphaera corsica]|uniref:Uncharacterized protein n=1 Tax=Poriferisphaera corsica TaxID=2528020 RepID=A0A517YPS6_9BACT|nr:hypothetical protein [Poriferisphaera corsica]QDU32229.1 hypothetical protein KS4_02590 [Poriferisphaera corsica]